MREEPDTTAPSEEEVAGETASVDAGEAATPSDAASPGAAAPAEAASADGAGAAAQGEEAGAAAAADGDEPAGAAEQKVEADLEELLAKAREERDEYLALAQRTQADFENFRKRKGREVAEAEQRGVARLARELLPALDSLDAALDHLPEEAAKGVELVRSELVAALGRVGIEGFSPEGEPFDPNEHEAMSKQPVEGAASGTVATVYQRGWRVNGTILRPARVVVAE